MRFTLELPSPASVVHDGDLDLLSSHVRDSPRGYFSSLGESDLLWEVSLYSIVFIRNSLKREMCSLMSLFI